MRVWRAPRASVAPGESSREKEPKPAAAALGGDGGGSEPGPRDEAPACPQLPGTAGELIGHHHRSSGITTPGRHAALGGPAPALPVRPRRAPGKELRGWLLGSPSGLRAAERTSTAGAPRGQQEEDGEQSWAEKPLLVLAAAPTYPLPPVRRRKGEDEEEEEKEREGGWGGRTGYKDRLGGGWWKIFGLLSSGFSCGGGGGSDSKRRKGSLSYDCRMLIAPAWVRGLQPETQPDSEVVQLCPGRDI